MLSTTELYEPNGQPRTTFIMLSLKYILDINILITRYASYLLMIILSGINLSPLLLAKQL